MLSSLQLLQKAAALPVWASSCTAAARPLKAQAVKEGELSFTTTLPAGWDGKVNGYTVASLKLPLPDIPPVPVALAILALLLLLQAPLSNKQA